MARPSAQQRLYEEVLLAQDLQACLLDSVGVLGCGLGAINRSWAMAINARRKAWRVLDSDLRTSFGGGGISPGRLNIPRDIALLPAGSSVQSGLMLPVGAGVCVADANNHRLQIFSKTGVAKRLIGENCGTEPGEFDCPQGLACDGTALYVSDTSNNRVQKLRLTDGEVIGTVGKAGCSEGDGEGQFYMPARLCVAGGALYTCDYLNHRIVVLGTDLSWRYTFGRQGSGDGEFDRPAAIAAHGGEIYVMDQCNHRAQVFAPDRDGRMRFARAFGGLGEAPGQFNCPSGVAIIRGLLVVSSQSKTGAGRLQVLTPKGTPLQVLALGSRLKGMCADDQRLWVADAGDNRVHVLPFARVT
jgi:DNA-binding beta-propeller fold protein YncE